MVKDVMEIMKDKDNQDFAVLRLEDYIKLNTMAKTQKPVNITSNDLIFISSVMQHLHLAFAWLELTNTTVKITGRTSMELSANTFEVCFDISLCSKYYNRVDKFINEVL